VEKREKMTAQQRPQRATMTQRSEAELMQRWKMQMQDAEA